MEKKEEYQLKTREKELVRERKPIIMLLAYFCFIHSYSSTTIRQWRCNFIIIKFHKYECFFEMEDSSKRIMTKEDDFDSEKIKYIMGCDNTYSVFMVNDTVFFCLDYSN